MRIPFQSLDGYAGRSQFFTDVVTNMEQELASRLLSRTLYRGVADGYVVTDVATISVTGVNISSGLAYNDQGVRTQLSGDVFLQLSHLDINKYVTAYTTEVTGQAVAHPLTGDLEYTRVTNSTIVSAIANPDQALGHIKLALIEDVRPGVTPEVDVRAIDLIDRDPLLGSPPFPYVTVGPSGSDADFTGNDEAPFLEAFEALTLTSGGTIFVKKGIYQMNIAGGTTVSGYETLRIIGEGRGTSWEFSGGSNIDIRFWNNGEVNIEGLSMYSNAGAGSHWLDFRDTGYIRFHDNFVSGGVVSTSCMGLGSGIGTVWIHDNHYTNKAVIPFRIYQSHASGSIEHVYFQDNYCSGTFFQFGEQIKDFVMSRNTLIDCDIDEDKAGIGGTPNGSTPDKPTEYFRFAENIYMGGQKSYGAVPGATSGPQFSTKSAVISSNIIYMDAFTTTGINVLDRKATGGKDGRFSVISDNFFMHRRSSSANCINIADANSSGISVGGNVLVADGSSANQKAILVTGRDSIVDDNISANFGTANSAGTETWMGSTNNTSNKEI